MGTYLILSTKKAQVKHHTIKVRPFCCSALNNPRPSPTHKVQPLGQKGKETATSPVSLQLRNTTWTPSLEMSSSVPQPSLESRTSTPQPRLKSRPSIRQPKLKSRTSTRQPSLESRTSTPQPSLEFRASWFRPVMFCAAGDRAEHRKNLLRCPLKFMESLHSIR